MQLHRQLIHCLISETKLLLDIEAMETAMA